MNGAGVLPLLVIVVAAGGMLSGVKDQIVIWGLLSLACYAFLIVVAHRIDRMEVASIDAAATRRLFLAAHFVSGLGWAYLTVIACNTC